MQKLKYFLYNWILPKLLSKKVGDRIPRSGAEGKKVNAYAIHLDLDGKPFMLVDGYEKEEIKGRKWVNDSYCVEKKIPVNEIDKYKFNLIHFYKLYDLPFTSIYRFAFHYFTRSIYLRIYIRELISSVNQYFFNKKKLVTIKRMQLLQTMLEYQLDSDKQGIHIILLMEKLYSTRWMYHPSGNSQKEILRLYLESLINSGEVIEKNNRYFVTGNAITTLERYEEEERRHIDSVKLQRKMISLTVMLVVVGLIQADVIKVPSSKKSTAI